LRLVASDEEETMTTATTTATNAPDAEELKIRVLVLLVASRCNLNCSYCYVYNAGDESWRSQPAFMSREVVAATIARVKEHCLRHGLDTFFFIFHGGEPLLAGMDFYRHFVATANEALLPQIKPVYRLQSNGVLLTEAWCHLLDDLEIGLGISVDGPQEDHDRHRVDHAGRGSYQSVVKGLQTVLSAGRQVNTTGILTVVDLNMDPLAVYEHHRSLGLRRIDFILPDATWDRPPPGLEGGGTPYADWLIAIFDRWFAEKPQTLYIRMFEHLMGLILGKPTSLDTMGTGRNEVLAIQADGGMEPVGSLNVCGNGFTKLGANVLRQSFDEAMDTDLARDYHLSAERRCHTCQSCPIGEVCGGGYLPWRYSREGGFDNPAVYCKDLVKLITHIQVKMSQAMPASMRARLLPRAWTNDEVLAVLPSLRPRRPSLRVL
jgi:uncharacterized protein